jgi:pimeloyl-ACP methyl ester carboxylesterase
MSSDGTASPTVVLVHGAFADASSWSPVLARLHAAAVPARAVVNPLRGLTADGEYVANLLAQIDGPVVLVGHSYGGPVMTYASSDAPNVKALVYVASFGLDTGVSTNGSVEVFPPSDLPPALRPLSYPNGPEPGTEYYIDPELFPAVFAADLPAAEARVLAYSQRPASGIAFGEPLAVTPGWKKAPSWFIVAGADRAINPDSERAAAQRMGATTSEIDGGSHAIALSQPDRVTAVILDALRAVS